MSEIEQEAGFVSLMDLANFNSDEVGVVLSRNPPSGIYTVKGLSCVGKQDAEGKDDKPPLVRFNFQFETLEAKLVKKDYDAATLIGRKINQSFTMWPAQLQEMIGLLKGMYQKVGLANTGKMGGAEGQEPGWLDGVTGAVFQIRVNVGQRNGQEQVYIDWLGPVKEAAAS